MDEELFSHAVFLSATGTQSVNRYGHSVSHWSIQRGVNMVPALRELTVQPEGYAAELNPVGLVGLRRVRWWLPRS